MKKKLGIFGDTTEDYSLIQNLLSLIKNKKLDYTNTFRELMSKSTKKQEYFKAKDFVNWHMAWKERLKKNNKSLESSLKIMEENNPFVRPRNHKVEEALEAISIDGDIEPVKKLLKIVSKPYLKQDGIDSYTTNPPTNDSKYQTFCGT